MGLIEQTHGRCQKMGTKGTKNVRRPKKQQKKK